MLAYRLGLVGISLGSMLAMSSLDSAQAQKKQRDLITREEILNSAKKNDDIYQAVRSLRPHFLAPPRGARTFGAAPAQEAVVYMDGNRWGELNGLKTIMALDVEEVRYLDPAKAQDQFGISANGGAILLTLVKKGKP